MVASVYPVASLALRAATLVSNPLSPPRATLRSSLALTTHRVLPWSAYLRGGGVGGFPSTGSERRLSFCQTRTYIHRRQDRGNVEPGWSGKQKSPHWRGQAAKHSTNRRVDAARERQRERHPAASQPPRQTDRQTEHRQPAQRDTDRQREHCCCPLPPPPHLLLLTCLASGELPRAMFLRARLFCASSTSTSILPALVCAHGRTVWGDAKAGRPPSSVNRVGRRQSRATTLLRQQYGTVASPAIPANSWGSRGWLPKPRNSEAGLYWNSR